MTKVELKNVKIIETPNATNTPETANGFTDVAAVLTNVLEIDNNRFILAPGDTDIPVAMGNISTAQIVILIADGPITVKLNGSSDAISVSQMLVLFGTSVTSITVTNPSATTQRIVRKYIGTTTT